MVLNNFGEYKAILRNPTFYSFCRYLANLITFYLFFPHFWGQFGHLIWKSAEKSRKNAGIFNKQ